jgi:hypothetical protein
MVSVPHLVGDIDPVPAVRGDVHPQIARNGQERYLLGILIDHGYDHHIGVLVPEVSG